MENIGENNTLIDLLSYPDTILDTKIKSIGLQEDKGIMSANVTFKMNSKSQFSRVELSFIGVEAFSFFYMKNYSLYVERVKFFQTVDNKYYLSLDPYDETHIISEEDGDFILADQVMGYGYR